MYSVAVGAKDIAFGYLMIECLPRPAHRISDIECFFVGILVIKVKSCWMGIKSTANTPTFHLNSVDKFTLTGEVVLIFALPRTVPLVAARPSKIFAAI